MPLSKVHSLADDFQQHIKQFQTYGPPKEKILSYLFHLVDRESGGRLNCNLSRTSAKWREILISEEEGVLNSKLEWIKGLPREKSKHFMDQIWYMASLCPLWSTLHVRKLCRIYYRFYWVDRQRGCRSNCYLKFLIVKRENMNESGPTGIEVGRIFGPNSLCCCLGPLIVHLWKETTLFGLAYCIRRCTVVCRIVNWKVLHFCNCV